jgi:DUF4097 and DUF4098 domain-containing protein YvlB
MRRFTLFAAVFVLIVLCGTHLPCHVSRAGHIAFAAENWSTGECRDEGNTHNSFGWNNQERVCELRTTRFATGSHLNVSSTNGGIEVIGEDRNDVAVEARVTAWAGSASEAKDILRQIAIETSGDSIRDNGPRFHWGSKGYGINYKLHVPRHLSVDLKSMNGGIDIAHLDSTIRFDTTNGGVELADLAGDVHGQTVNGGLSIQLTGDRWRGKGLDAETTNGGVELGIPEGYSAHLETGTVNGGFEFAFPITLQGDIKKHLSIDLGKGGPTIHAKTTNGGVSVSHKTNSGEAM